MMRPTLVALAIVLTALPAAGQTPASSPAVIVATGEATLKKAPDRAWVTVSTEARDPNAAEARRKNAEAMTAVQNALKGAGVESGAIRTTGFSLMPEMDWNNGRGILRGYVARNQIEVRVDNLDRLPAILDASNSPKGVGLSVGSPRFDLKDEQSAENEALRLAVEAAMARAQAMAAGAKRSLGQVLRVDDQQAGPIVPVPMPMAMRAAPAQMEASTPITPGEIEVRGRVTITVELR